MGVCFHILKMTWDIHLFIAFRILDSERGVIKIGK